MASRSVFASIPGTASVFLNTQEAVMPYAGSALSGFCFGVGLILAAAAMRVILHIGICG